MRKTSQIILSLVPTLMLSVMAVPFLTSCSEGPKEGQTDIGVLEIGPVAPGGGEQQRHKVMTYQEATDFSQRKRIKNGWTNDPVRPSPKYLEYRRVAKDNYWKKLEKPPEEVKSSSVKMTVTASGLKYVDIEKGNGLYPQNGGRTLIHYTAWLQDGTKFDSSLEKCLPFKFVYGQGKVIPGLEEGLKDMRVGGTRTLVIPPELAYGKDGHGKHVPANATLIYKVTLLSAGKGLGSFKG